MVSASVIISTGNIVETGLYNTSGNLATSLVSTGNALFTGLYNSSGMPAASGAKIITNEGRLSTIETSGLATIDTNLKAVMNTGALSGSAINLAASGAGYSTRISTIETSGVATVANLISSGNILFTGLYNVSGNLAYPDATGALITAIQESGVVTGLGSAPSVNNHRVAFWDGTDGLTFNTTLNYDPVNYKLVVGAGGIQFADASAQNTSFENWSIVVNSPDKEYYNLITAGSNTIGSGAIVEFTGDGGIFATGELDSSYSPSRHKVTISGVSGTTSEVGVVQLQDTINTSTVNAVTPNSVNSVVISTGNALFTGLYNTSGNMVSSSNLISTGNIVETGLYNTSGNLATSLVSTGNALFTGLYNTSGNMVSASVIISTGNIVETGLYNTSGNLATSLVSTGNALFTGLYNSSGVPAATGAKITLNDSRLSTIETSGMLTGVGIAALHPASYDYLALAAWDGTNGLTTLGQREGADNDFRVSVPHKRLYLATGGVQFADSTISSTSFSNWGIQVNGPRINSTEDEYYQNFVAAGGSVYDGSGTVVQFSGASGIRLSGVANEGYNKEGRFIATTVKVDGAPLWTGLYGTGPRTPIVSGAGGTVVTFDLSAGTTFTHTLGANTTFYLANVTQGQKFVIRTQQDGTASRSVTWGFGSAGHGAIRWAEGGTAPTGTEYPAGVADVYGFIAIATGAFDGFVIGNDLK